MSLYSVSKAVLILLWMAVRYIFVCLSWKPLFKRSRGKQEGLKLYFNGDIILPEKANKDHHIKEKAVVTCDQTIVFIGPLSEAEEYVRNQKGGNHEAIDLKGQTLSPGFVDPHLHPSMAAIILSMDFITPFDWNFPWSQYKGVRNQIEYRKRLSELCDSKGQNEWVFVWGYHPLFHGPIDKSVLDDLCPKRPLVLWHRSFHAVHLNSIALQNSGLCKSTCQTEPHMQWEEGHFFEQGLERLMEGQQILLQLFPRLEKGYEKVAKAVKAGGITTIADMEVCTYNNVEITEFM